MIFLEPSSDALTQKRGRINVEREENAQILAGVAIGVRVAALVVGHAALQRVVGGHLGERRVPRHGRHVEGAGEAAQSAACQQIASIVVLLQDERNVRIEWDELAPTAARKLLTSANN